jgi:hypothetical protein
VPTPRCDHTFSYGDLARKVVRLTARSGLHRTAGGFTQPGDLIGPAPGHKATLISALVGFLPLIWLSLAFVGRRAFSGHWLLPGTG